MKRNILFALIALFFMASCSKEEANILMPSDFNYGFISSFQTEFKKAGSSDEPVINWNGNTGTFKLGEENENISINTTTGVISWDENLPLGRQEIEVIATNDAGSTNTFISIDIKFQGEFSGGFNNNPNSTSLTNFIESLTFNLGGTISITYDGNTGSGQYLMNGNNIRGNFTINETTMYIDGELETEGIPSVIGKWGYEKTSINDGYFKIKMVD